MEFANAAIKLVESIYVLIVINVVGRYFLQLIISTSSLFEIQKYPVVLNSVAPREKLYTVA